MTKISNLSSTDSFFQAQNAPKSVFDRGSAGGAYDASPDPLVGCGGDTPSPFPSPLDAFDVSNSARLSSQAPLNTKSILAAPVSSILCLKAFKLEKSM